MKYAVAILLILSTSTLFAQLRYGLKSGVNFSDVVLNNVIDPQAESDYRMKVGWQASVFLQLDLENDFLIWSELGYSRKGVRTADSKVSLHYAVIPVLAQYRLTPKFLVEGGVELAYLISATSPYGNVSSVWDNKTDLGIDAGVAYTLPDWVVGIRFNAGISNVVQNDQGIRYQNRVFSFTLARFIGSRQL